MRILLALTLLLALGVPPASAQKGTQPTPVAAHAGVAHAPVMAQGRLGHHAAHGVRLHRERHRHLVLRNAHFGRTAGFAPFFWSDTVGAYEEPALAPAEEGVAPAGPLPPFPRPLRHPGDDRATIETTPFGVTVIRGPGSRHIAP